MPTTTKWGLRYPTLTDAANVPTRIQQAVEDVDTNMAAWLANTLALRPAAAAGTVGRLVRETDQDRLRIDIGGSYRAILYQILSGDMKADVPIDATALKIAGTLLASTHLSDSAALARLASPALSGVPTAPTAAIFTNTTQVATAALVEARGQNIDANWQSGWPWQLYTPNLILSGAGAFSIGNAIRNAQYIRYGKMVRYQGQISFGSTTTWTGAGTLHLTLPVAADTGSVARDMSGVVFDEVGGGATSYLGTVQLFSGTEFIINAMKPQTSTKVQIGITQPFTWATNSILSWDFTYRVA